MDSASWGESDASPHYKTPRGTRAFKLDQNSPAVIYGNSPGSRSEKGAGEAMVGRHVRKLFGNKMYEGVVQSYDPQVSWYHIKYEDSDEEEVDLEELQDILIDNSFKLKKNQVQEKLVKLSKSDLHLGSMNQVCLRKRKRSTTNLPQESESDDMADFPMGMAVRTRQFVDKGLSRRGRSSCERVENPPLGKRNRRSSLVYSDGVDRRHVGRTGFESSVSRCVSFNETEQIVRHERMKPLKWPKIRRDRCKPKPALNWIKRAQQEWHLSEECIDLLTRMGADVHVDEVLDERQILCVKECQRAYYNEWVKHDELEREKIKRKGRGSGIYGKLGINNAIRIAERSMEGKKINTGILVGHVPGIPVSLQLQVRGELSCLGLHQPKNRVACVHIVDLAEHKVEGMSVPIALSVVVSRSKNVGHESMDEMIYQENRGGNINQRDVDRMRYRCYRIDQGLANCHRFGIPIRIIRQVNDNSCVLRCRYSYEGLWHVTEAWSDSYRVGSMKFRFVKISEGNMDKSIVKLRPKEQVLCEDISFGMEATQIPVVNDVDDVLPPGVVSGTLGTGNLSNSQHTDDSFQYTSQYVYHPSVRAPRTPNLPPVQDPHALVEKLNMCSPYIVQKFAKLPLLNQRRSLLYECGSWCSCHLGSDCYYAVTERGIKFQLQVFRTVGKGWGIRTLEFIPAGAFVTTYTGVIIPHEDLVVSSGRSEYMFDMCRRTDMSDDNQFLDNHRSDIKVRLLLESNQGKLIELITPRIAVNGWDSYKCTFSDLMFGLLY